MPTYMMMMPMSDSDVKDTQNLKQITTWLQIVPMLLRVIAMSKIPKI